MPFIFICDQENDVQKYDFVITSIFNNDICYEDVNWFYEHMSIDYTSNRHELKLQNYFKITIDTLVYI